MNIKNKKQNGKGASLIETLMVLTMFILSSVVISGAIAYYQSASENQKTKETSTLLQSANRTLEIAFDGLAIDYKNLATDGGAIHILLNSANIPEKYKNGNEITTPFGGKLIISSLLTGSELNSKILYSIETCNVPISACATLGLLDFGDGHKFTKFANQEAKKEDLTPSRVNNLCQNARGDEITIMYAFDSKSR